MGQSVQSFQRDLAAMIELVKNARTDLFAKIPHGDGQTILRQTLVLADHNSYHLASLSICAERWVPGRTTKKSFARDCLALGYG